MSVLSFLHLFRNPSSHLKSPKTIDVWVVTQVQAVVASDHNLGGNESNSQFWKMENRWSLKSETYWNHVVCTCVEQKWPFKMIMCIYNHVVNLGHGGLVQATPTIGGNKTNMFRVWADLSRWTSLNIYPMFILIPKQLWLVKRAKLWTKCCAAKVAIINLGVMNSVGNVALTGKGQYCQYCSLQMCMLLFHHSIKNSRRKNCTKNWKFNSWGLKKKSTGDQFHHFPWRGQKHLKWPCRALASDKLHFISLLLSKIKIHLA